MSIIDKLLIGHLILQAGWAIVFLIWQFVEIDIQESTWKTIIRFFNVIEVIVFIVTRFVSFGKWGALALCGFYIINILLLTLQFTFANWGMFQKMKDILWITYYVVLILVDIVHIDIIGMLIQSDIFLRDSWIGGVIKSVIVAFAKLWLDAKLKND